MVEAGRNYLRRMGRDENDMKLDLIKLPHHGSSHNLNHEFLQFFRTKRYLISTSGHEGINIRGKKHWRKLHQYLIVGREQKYTVIITGGIKKIAFGGLRQEKEIGIKIVVS